MAADLTTAITAKSENLYMHLNASELSAIIMKGKFFKIRFSPVLIIKSGIFFLFGLFTKP